MDRLISSFGDATTLTPAKAVMNKIVHSVLETENSSINAWNVNFSSGNVNNNNKNNSNVVRPVCANELSNLSSEIIAGWVEAYVDCCRHKKSSKDCIHYRLQAWKDLWKLIDEVYNFTYEPSISRCFVVTRPKPREVFAASFRDRIVQHWIMLRLTPLFEERFINQGNVSFNCRKGFGPLRAVNTLEDKLKELTCNYKEQAYIGKFDIVAFFMSIDKNKVLDLLIPFINKNYKGDDKDTLIRLAKITILSCPQKNCFRTSPRYKWKLLSQGKSLFGLSNDKALPIGNITSQEVANFFLSSFDEFMLSRCKEAGAEYIRFVDDFVIVCKDKKFITGMYKESTKWLKSNLGLELHQDKVYVQEVHKGVKFIGTFLKPFRRYTSNSTVGSLDNLMHDVDQLCKHVTKRSVGALYALKKAVCSINSYMGFMVHNNTYGLRRMIFGKASNFWKICYTRTNFKSFIVKNRFNFNLKLFKEVKKHELEQREYYRCA